MGGVSGSLRNSLGNVAVGVHRAASAVSPNNRCFDSGLHTTFAMFDRGVVLH